MDQNIAGQRINKLRCLDRCLFCLVINATISTNLYLYCCLWYLYTIKPYIISLRKYSTYRIHYDNTQIYCKQTYRYNIDKTQIHIQIKCKQYGCNFLFLLPLLLLSTCCFQCCDKIYTILRLAGRYFSVKMALERTNVILRWLLK